MLQCFSQTGPIQLNQHWSLSSRHVSTSGSPPAPRRCHRCSRAHHPMADPTPTSSSAITVSRQPIPSTRLGAVAPIVLPQASFAQARSAATSAIVRVNARSHRPPANRLRRRKRSLRSTRTARGNRLFAITDRHLGAEPSALQRTLAPRKQGRRAGARRRRHRHLGRTRAHSLAARCHLDRPAWTPPHPRAKPIAT